MKIPENVKEILLNAEGKSLATSSRGKINVIPVSTIKIVNDKIWLVNYFMDKTLENILENNEVALACWKKLEGYQIKGQATYIFDHKDKSLQETVKWISEILPERVVKGFLILEPIEIFDISAGKERAGKKIQII
jgi:uncharacterized pyridoxamine 5'-phosphate oxidase family protein